MVKTMDIVDRHTTMSYKYLVLWHISISSSLGVVVKILHTHSIVTIFTFKGSTTVVTRRLNVDLGDTIFGFFKEMGVKHSNICYFSVQFYKLCTRSKIIECSKQHR